MNVVPQQTLRRIIEKYGNQICGDARRCENLLKDLCGEYRREINVLTSAVEERIALDLLAAQNSMPRQLLVHKLAKRLEDNLGMTPEAARWAVDSWAFALGIISENQIEIGKKEAHNSTPPAASLNPNSQISKIQSPDAQTGSMPRLPPTINTPQSPKVFPSNAGVAVNFPQPQMPPGGLNASRQQNQTLPVDMPGNITAPKKVFRKFFGCFFALFLIVIIGAGLLFGVPFAIKVMRETQQSAPPRFPSD